MSQSKIDIQSKNILSAYWLAKAASEHLSAVWSDKHLIKDKDMKEAIQQSLPKLNFFCNNVEATFTEANVKTEYLNNQKEFIYNMIDEIWDNNYKTV